MTTFLDGPAKGVTLELRRSPAFLRVTRSGEKWDALDQLDDEPFDEEVIFVYKVVSQPTHGFIDYRSKSGRREGRQFTNAEYRLYVFRPVDEAALRDNRRWGEWAQAEGEKLQAEGKLFEEYKHGA